MNAEATTDPHWDLVIEIAAKLWVHGTYEVELVPVPAQRFVDLQWAARQAGKVLGARSSVGVSQPRGARDGPVTVTVTITYADPGRQGDRRAEAGLEALMRQVLEDQAGGSRT